MSLAIASAFHDGALLMMQTAIQIEDCGGQLWVRGGGPAPERARQLNPGEPTILRLNRRSPQNHKRSSALHARGPDPRAPGSVDNDDELCPKPAYLQAPWIIGKRAFETDYCASLPGTAILAFKPRENPVNVG